MRLHGKNFEKEKKLIAQIPDIYKNIAKNAYMANLADGVCQITQIIKNKFAHRKSVAVGLVELAHTMAGMNEGKENENTKSNKKSNNYTCVLSDMHKCI